MFRPLKGYKYFLQQYFMEESKGSQAVCNIKKNWWCQRVSILLDMMTTHIHTFEHMFFFGPPGSGKTTASAWIVDKIWGKRKNIMCMMLNASNERTLDMTRERIYPFINMDWRDETEKRIPRFVILDECETLTEAAQLSLQPLFDFDTCDICVILISNSRTKIHTKIKNKLLNVRFDPPIKNLSIVESLTRGDLRCDAYRSNYIQQRIWHLIHEHPENLRTLICKTYENYNYILQDILIISEILEVLDTELINQINHIYPYLHSSQIHNRITSNNILFEKIQTLIKCFVEKLST